MYSCDPWLHEVIAHCEFVTVYYALEHKCCYCNYSKCNNTVVWFNLLAGFLLEYLNDLIYAILERLEVQNWSLFWNAEILVASLKLITS